MQDGLTEEGLSSFYVPMLAEVEVDRLTSLVDRAVEVHPFAFDLDIGLIHPPRTPDRLGILAPALLKDRNKADHPAHDRGVGHREAPFRHHLHEIAVAELIANVPANAEDDHQAVEMAAFEQMVGECHAHDCRPTRVLAPEPLRGIGRAVQVSLRWLIDFITNCYAATPDDLSVRLPEQPDGVIVRRLNVEADELWSFVGKKVNKPWRWLALDGKNREVF